MKNREKKRLSLLVCLALLWSLAACAVPAEETAAETVPVEETEKTISLRLGTSAFSFTVPASYKEGELTEEDIAEGQVAYYYSNLFLMDFDVYQFAAEGDTLAEFVAEEAAACGGTDIVTDGEIQGIPVCSYRFVEKWEDMEYNAIAYAFEDNGEYVQVVFWLDGDTAEKETEAIISTLSR